MLSSPAKLPPSPAAAAPASPPPEGVAACFSVALSAVGKPSLAAPPAGVVGALAATVGLVADELESLIAEPPALAPPLEAAGAALGVSVEELASVAWLVVASVAVVFSELLDVLVEELVSVA